MVNIHLLSGFPGGSMLKNLPANAGDMGDASLISGSGRSPGVRNGTHTSILAQEIPWTEEPGRLQSMWWQRVRQDSATKRQLYQPRSKQRVNWPKLRQTSDARAAPPHLYTLFSLPYCLSTKWHDCEAPWKSSSLFSKFTHFSISWNNLAVNNLLSALILRKALTNRQIQSC